MVVQRALLSDRFILIPSLVSSAYFSPLGKLIFSLHNLGVKADVMLHDASIKRTPRRVRNESLRSRKA